MIKWDNAVLAQNFSMKEMSTNIIRMTVPTKIARVIYAIG